MAFPPRPRSPGAAGFSTVISGISIGEPSSLPTSDKMPPSPLRTTPPPSLPSVLHMKRSNPKALSLSLPLSTSSFVPSLSTPLTICPTPPMPGTDVSSKYGTPYTPGPPKTPALALSLGRSAAKGLQRPSLLSLITQPPTSSEVPPSPGGIHPYAATQGNRGRLRARSSTSEEVSSHTDLDRRFRSASPGGKGFAAIDELAASSQYNHQLSPTTTSSSTSAIASTSTTPSTSPPTHSYDPRPVEPYSDGPIEIFPGIFLGAEESVWHWHWAGGRKRVRVLNVAQEVDDPFEEASSQASGKGKERVKMASYLPDAERPGVEYCHLRWSHGETGLADLPQGARLSELPDATPTGGYREIWGFWEAIRWLEAGRRAGEPLLIHCQCGVSRSATLAVAYIMALAASGFQPNLLGHLRGMQDSYEYVKLQSPWIGPNVSLVFQLVEFARNLTTLLSVHHGDVVTSFPKHSDHGLSEAEWAKRRAAFDKEDGGEGEAGGKEGMKGLMSPEEVQDEARRWDEAMVERRRLRE